MSLKHTALGLKRAAVLMLAIALCVSYKRSNFPQQVSLIKAMLGPVWLFQ